MKRYMAWGMSAMILAVTLMAVIFVRVLAEDTALYADLDTPSVSSGGGDVTVRMKVKTAKPIKVCAIGFTAEVPEDMELVGFENSSGDVRFAAEDFNLKNGRLSWMDSSLNDVEADEIATLVIRVPAGTPEGTYTISLKKLKVLADYGTKTVINGMEAACELEVTSGGGQEYDPADVNRDGTVDAEDTVLMMCAVTDPGSQAGAPDLNGDGAADHLDSLLLFRTVAGQDTGVFSGPDPKIKGGIAVLYGKSGEIERIYILDGRKVSCEPVTPEGVSLLRVFYIGDSFVPAAEQSVITM